VGAEVQRRADVSVGFDMEAIFVRMGDGQTAEHAATSTGELLAITPGGTQEPALGHAPVHTGDISEMCRSLFRTLIYPQILLKTLFDRGKAGVSPIVGSEGVATHS
jgi:hypothetical protein